MGRQRDCAWRAMGLFRRACSQTGPKPFPSWCTASRASSPVMAMVLVLVANHAWPGVRPCIVAAVWMLAPLPSCPPAGGMAMGGSLPLLGRGAWRHAAACMAWHSWSGG